MKNLYLNCLVIVVLFVSCKKEDNTPPPPPVKYIGQTYQGGRIGYIDASGQHGLIVAQTSLQEAPWGCYGTNLDLNEYGSNYYGEGAQNTIVIMNGCGTGTAAQLCGDLVEGGYSDWFLPSKDELNLLYINKDLINLYALSGVVYWSSTKVTGNNYAWSQDFTIGDQHKDTRGTSKYVIAVRYF